MVNDYILARLTDIDVLPTFPETVKDIVALIDDPRSSSSDLARYMDPSVAGEVLRAANSSCSGRKGFPGISSLEHAIAVMGLERLLRVILHMPFISMTGTDADAFDRGLFVRHSFICGILAKAMSARFHRGVPNEVYISGIMHDVGVIIIFRYFNAEWHEINLLINEKKMSRVKAEREVLSTDHGHVGAALLDLWNTPKSITDGVRFHHEPEAALERGENVLITRLANELAKGVDLEEDLSSFDDFAAKHRRALESATRVGKALSPSEEVEFLESIYRLLRESKNHLECITEEGNDKSSHS